MGKVVFGIENNNAEVINKIQSMYESVGISTNLNAYDIDDKVLENITQSLEKHGMSKIGERGNITLDMVKEILQMSMY